jgi:hypothetical protein
VFGAELAHVEHHRASGRTSHLTRHTLLSRRATKRPCVAAIHGAIRVFRRINPEALRCAKQPCAFSTLMAVCQGVGSGSPLPKAMKRSSGVAFPIAHPAAQAGGGTGRFIGLYS